MEKEEIYTSFEQRLLDRLVELCTGRGYLKGIMQSSPDIDDKWESMAKQYFADAVKEYNKYPQVAISWAAYLGMGVAHKWDKDINIFNADTYEDYYGPRKFDDMDEYITRDILKIPLASQQAGKLRDLLIDCSTIAMDMIRREGIEGGTSEAFQIFVRIAKTMFRIGAAIELKRLGYNMVPMYGGLPS